MENGEGFLADTEPQRTELGSIHGEGDWQKIAGILRKSIGADAFQRWFGGASWGGSENGKGTVVVPGEIHQVWIETNYLPELLFAAGEAQEGIHHIKIAVAESAVTPGGQPVLSEPQVRKQLPGDMLDKRAKAAGLNPDYTFANFVVGSNSQFAHAACEAVSAKKA